MSIQTSELRLPKQAIPILNNYVNLQSGQTDDLREKIEQTFEELKIIKQNISRVKLSNPTAEKDLGETQQTWLGWIVHHLSADNCLLNAIRNILCRIFPSFQKEAEKQNKIQESIKLLQTHKAEKQKKLGELTQLQAELRQPTIFSDEEFLRQILQNPIFPVPNIIYRGNLEKISINDISAPIMSGIAFDEEGGRFFFTLTGKTQDGTFHGLLCYQRFYSPDYIFSTDEKKGTTWIAQEFLGPKFPRLSDTYLVRDGFIQEELCTILENLVQEGCFTSFFDQEGERFFDRYVLATPEEITTLKNLNEVAIN